MLINKSQKKDPLNKNQALSGRRVQGLHCHMGPCGCHHLSHQPLTISEELLVTMSYMYDDFTAVSVKRCSRHHGGPQPVSTFLLENVSWLQWEKVEYIVPYVMEVWLEEKEHVQNGP